MAVNKYFRSFHESCEQELISELHAECNQAHGIDVYYIPRTLVNEDYLYGEDPQSAFEEYFEIEMYLESFEGYGDDVDLMSKFGMFIKDEADFDVNRARFIEETSMDKPREGDLIYIPMSKSLFEVRFVENEREFYELGVPKEFKIRCKLFEYSRETMETGIPELDRLEDNLDDSGYGEEPHRQNEEVEAEGDSVIDADETSPHGSF